MPLTYSALVPHSPILLPTIGKEKRSEIIKTVQAYELIQKKVTEHDIETILVLTTPDQHKKHGPKHRLCLSAEYITTFSDFGDIVTSHAFASDAVLGSEIKADLARAGQPVIFNSKNTLDYTSGIPLMLLATNQKMKVLVIQPAETELAALYAFGQIVCKSLQRSSRKIMCVASGDFARCIHKKEHEHYSQRCMPFDFMLTDAIQKKTPESLLAFDRGEAEKLGACVLPVAVVLRGILDPLEWTARQISYEAPFGVGYGVIEFEV